MPHVGQECGRCGHLMLHHSPGCNWKGCNCPVMLVPLTRREYQVLKAMATGSGAKGAARQLNLSVKTIEAHRYNMCRKIEAHSTLELVLMALRCGVITLEDLPDSGKQISRPEAA